MAGQTTLRVENCPAGTEISMQHAEIIYPNGLVHDSFCERKKYWLCNLRQFANYTCSGVGTVETYRVTFASMGFRYVQLIGFPGVPTAESLTAHFIHSDVPKTGEFVTNLPLLNAIQHATVAAARSNQMDIPTDCPQREREGWLGDTLALAETANHPNRGCPMVSRFCSAMTVRAPDQVTPSLLSTPFNTTSMAGPSTASGSATWQTSRSSTMRHVALTRQCPTPARSTRAHPKSLRRIRVGGSQRGSCRQSLLRITTTIAWRRRSTRTKERTWNTGFGSARTTAANFRRRCSTQETGDKTRNPTHLKPRPIPQFRPIYIQEGFELPC